MDVASRLCAAGQPVAKAAALLCRRRSRPSPSTSPRSLRQGEPANCGSEVAWHSAQQTYIVRRGTPECAFSCATNGLVCLPITWKVRHLLEGPTEKHPARSMLSQQRTRKRNCGTPGASERLQRFAELSQFVFPSRAIRNSARLPLHPVRLRQIRGTWPFSESG